MRHGGFLRGARAGWRRSVSGFGGGLKIRSFTTVPNVETVAQTFRLNYSLPISARRPVRSKMRRIRGDARRMTSPAAQAREAFNPLSAPLSASVDVARKAGASVSAIPASASSRATRALRRRRSASKAKNRSSRRIDWTLTIICSSPAMRPRPRRRRRTP
jgi:hypothetical protein